MFYKDISPLFRIKQNWFYAEYTKFQYIYPDYG